jgi:hypothetical protein
MLYRPALHGNWNALSLARRTLKDKFPTLTVPLTAVLTNRQVFLPDSVYNINELKNLIFKKEFCLMKFVGCIISEWEILKKEEKVTHTHTHSHTFTHKPEAAEMTFFWQHLNKFWGLDKFRDKVGNWREHNKRVEKDIPKVAFRYTVQEDETERYKLRVESCSIKIFFVYIIMSYCQYTSPLHINRNMN